MSDRGVQTNNDTDGPTGQSIRSYQSVWMAHWTRTSCKAVPKVHNSLFDRCENKEDDHDAMQHPLLSALEIASDVSKCGEGFREATEARTVNTMKEGLPLSMKASGNEKLDCQTFPMFNPCRNRESTLARKNDPTTTHKQVLRSQVDCKSGNDATNLAAKKSHFPLALAWAPPDEGTSSTEYHFQPEGFDSHGRHGVKLQPIEGSIDSQGKEDVGDVRISAINSKNESSAETDTMNMDAFQEENHLSGAVSSPLNKELLTPQNQQTSVATIAPAREFRGGLLTSDLPDMNQELPALPAPASSMDDKEASTSRTQSLDVDHILAHAEEPINSKSSTYPDGSLEFDPSSRWVKRLRVSASDSFAHGTKTSKMGETSSNEKLNKFFSKIMKHNMTRSEFTWGRRHGQEPMELDQTALLLRNGDSSSVHSVKKSQDITLSHSWIRRWCRNRSVTPKKKPDTVVVCEPQSSKVDLDKFQKKQFPSIAAMALMGKAVTGFRPCEFRKRGSLVVWDAQRF